MNKWNFDFKVEVTEELSLGKGSHGEIILDFQHKKHENPDKFNMLLQSLSDVYEGSENDIDILLTEYPDLEASFQTGAKVGILLKVIKWLFIMEDIVYWNYQGRSMLYNGLRAV